MGYPATGKSAAAEWVCLPEVSNALAEISQLKMIKAEVIEAVHPPGGLTDAHMYELLSLSADAATATIYNRKFTGSLLRNDECVYKK